MNRFRATRFARLAPILLILLPAAASLNSCGLYTQPTAEDREARRDCDAEADRIFAVRNRYQVSERDESDTPYSGNTLPSNPTAGLSDQYEQDKLVDACLAQGPGAHSGASTSGPAGGPATATTTLPR